jgi:hypothetical protein
MAAPNSTYTQAFSSAIANYRDSAADDVTRNLPLLAILSERGNIDPYDGGVEITEQVLYNEVAASGWYTGSDQQDVEVSDVLTTAAFAHKQFYANIVQDGLEEIQNAGESQMIDLIEAKMDAGMATVKNAVGTAFFNSNTENGGKAIGGFQHLVSDNASAPTVGGIDASSSNNAFWRNYVMDFSNNSLTPGTSTILQGIQLGFLNTNRGNDMVDVIFGGDTYFGYFESAIQSNQRFINETSKVIAGFKAWEYKGAKVIHDPNCSATRMYGINTKYVKFRPYKKRNFIVGERKDSINQDAYLFPVLFAGNLTVKSRKRHFVMVA